MCKKETAKGLAKSSGKVTVWCCAVGEFAADGIPTTTHQCALDESFIYTYVADVAANKQDRRRENTSVCMIYVCVFVGKEERRGGEYGRNAIVTLLGFDRLFSANLEQSRLSARRHVSTQHICMLLRVTTVYIYVCIYE